MGIKDELSSDIEKIIQHDLDIHNGLNVPAIGKLPLENGVRFDATILCAGFTYSIKPVTDFQQRAAAKAVRIFLRCMCRLITANGGTVIIYDAQKVTGIFLGDMRNTNATTCALKMNYVTLKMITPALNEYFMEANEQGFGVMHCVGVDTGPILAIRAGLSSSNDVIWVGRAPILASKLSENRNSPLNTYISEDTFFMLFEQAKFSPDNSRQLMWEESTFDYLGEKLKVYRSARSHEP